MIGPMIYESAVASARQDLEVGSYSGAVSTLEGWLATQGVATPQTQHAAHLLIVALACRYAVEERVSEQLKPYIPGLIEAAELLSEDGALAEVKRRLPDLGVFATAKDTKERLDWLGQECELRELRRTYLHAFLAGDPDQLDKNVAHKRESRFSDLRNDKKEAAVRRLIDEPLYRDNQQLYQPIYQPIYTENRLADWKQVAAANEAIEQGEGTDGNWRILLREGENSGQVIHPRVAPLLSMLLAAKRLGAVDITQDPGAHLLALHAAQQTLSAEPMPINGNGSQKLMDAVRRHVMGQIAAGHAAWTKFANGLVDDLETADVEGTARGLTWLRAYVRVFPGKMDVRQPLADVLKLINDEIGQIATRVKPKPSNRSQSQERKELAQRGMMLAALRDALKALSASGLVERSEVT